MIEFAAGFVGGAFTATGYAIYQVRGLRRQLQRAGTATFKAQARRAQQFNQFCEPCKTIINPSWSGLYETELTSEQAAELKVRFESLRSNWPSLVDRPA